jgi:diguanylate cyclase (GGDEF)-like protein
VAGKHKKKLLMHRKEFVNESVTEAQYELVDDDDLEGNLNELVLKSARLFEIADEKQKLYHQQSITDSLTGLHNLRYILEEGERLFNHAKEEQLPIAILMLDIDYFKVVNDTFGHHTGDNVLCKLAEICRKSMRETDLIGRYGGEEFVVILPNTMPERAREIAERLRKGVEATVFNEGEGVNVNLTISIGINNEKSQDLTFGLALQNADRALYFAKHKGRNQIAVYTQT